jgi:CheY-like chemotaxis protein
MTSQLHLPDLPARQQILVVEDDQATCLLFQTVLPNSYDLDVESDPVAALEMARKISYDVILLDIHLGDTRIDGIGVLQKLRHIDGYEGRPIIAITAYAMPGDQQQFLDEGFDGYVPKPFTKKTLFSTLEGVLSEEKEE